jgi:hypothetical protein
MADRGSVPSSFPKTLKACNNLPDSLASRLDKSWSTFGKKVTEYRDCLQHYCPIGRELPYAHMQRLQGGVWSTSIWIPDNPEARSQREYRYDSRIDALTYGWQITNEILDVARSIIKEIPEKVTK